MIEMHIRNILHKGLRRLVENDDASGVQPAVEIIDLDF
jgi:hypothetical protein